jgi:hypothetical protein
MLLIFAGLVGRKLNSLQVGAVHWSMFANRNGRDLQILLEPLEHLTRLSLVITIGAGEDLFNYGHDAEECEIALSEGGLARFIKGLPKLQALSVSFDLHDEDIFAFSSSSEAILDPDGHWPHLRELELSWITVDAENMIAFFEKHRGTLTALTLQDIYLTSKLRSFFSKIRDILDLQAFHAFGSFWEDDDDMDYVDERWFLRWPEQTSLVRDALKNFVLGRGEYPLTPQCVAKLEANDIPDIWE